MSRVSLKDNNSLLQKMKIGGKVKTEIVNICLSHNFCLKKLIFKNRTTIFKYLNLVAEDSLNFDYLKDIFN